MEKSGVLLGIIILLLVALMGTTVGISLFTIRTINDLRGDYPFIREGPRDLRIDEMTTVRLPSQVTVVTSPCQTVNRQVQVEYAIRLDATQGRESDTIEQRVNDHRDEINIRVLEIVQSYTLDVLVSTGKANVIAEQLLDWLQDQFQSNLIVGVSVAQWIIA